MSTELVDTQIEQHLENLFKIGSVKREKAIILFSKILSKIISYPTEEKYQSLNHPKISTKFNNLQCLFMIELLLFSGFIIDGNRLKLKQNKNKTEYIMNKLNNKIKFEKQKLEQEKLKIIEQNKKRLQTKSNLKKKQLKNKILLQHKQQMNLAKQGIYNVKATVSDRKGTGNGVNSLGI
eukprot:144443_1